MRILKLESSEKDRRLADLETALRAQSVQSSTSVQPQHGGVKKVSADEDKRNQERQEVAEFIERQQKYR